MYVYIYLIRLEVELKWGFFLIVFEVFDLNKLNQHDTFRFRLEN